MRVDRDTFAGRWPLTVDACELVADGCAMFVRTDDGKLWPLNGIAITAAKSGTNDIQPTLHPIWRASDTPGFAELGMKVPVTDLLSCALMHVHRPHPGCVLERRGVVAGS